MLRARSIPVLPAPPRRGACAALVLAAAAALLAGCVHHAPAPAPTPPPAPMGFSGERAAAVRADLEAASGAEEARARARARLEEQGLEVGPTTIEVDAAEGPVSVTHLGAEVPGDGSAAGRVLLLAPLTRSLGGAPADASAAALVLELARVLAERPAPVHVSVVLLEGELPSGPDAWLGSRTLAHALAQQDGLGDLRLVVYVDRLGGPGHAILRDRRSHRRSRDAFFQEAAGRGVAGLFPSGAEYAAPESGHLAFADVGVRRIVLLSTGPEETGGEPAAAPSAERLDALGEVTEATLRRLSTWWREVDRMTGADMAAPAPRATEDATQDVPAAASGDGA